MQERLLYFNETTVSNNIIGYTNDIVSTSISISASANTTLSLVGSGTMMSSYVADDSGSETLCLNDSCSSSVSVNEITIDGAIIFTITDSSDTTVSDIYTISIDNEDFYPTYIATLNCDTTTYSGTFVQGTLYDDNSLIIVNDSNETFGTFLGSTERIIRFKFIFL